MFQCGLTSLALLALRWFVTVPLKPFDDRDKLQRRLPRATPEEQFATFCANVFANSTAGQVVRKNA